MQIGHLLGKFPGPIDQRKRLTTPSLPREFKGELTAEGCRGHGHPPHHHMAGTTGSYRIGREGWGTGMQLILGKGTMPYFLA